MAAQQLCDGPDQGPAEYIISMIEAAEVAGFCGACMADFCQAYLQAVAPDRLAPPPKPAPKRTRKAAAAAAANGTAGGDSNDSTGQPPEGTPAGVGSGAGNTSS